MKIDLFYGFKAITPECTKISFVRNKFWFLYVIKEFLMQCIFYTLIGACFAFSFVQLLRLAAKW